MDFKDETSFRGMIHYNWFINNWFLINYVCFVCMRKMKEKDRKREQFSLRLQIIGFFLL